VYAWGETKYGKLGLGSLSARVNQESRRETANEEDKSEGSESGSADIQTPTAVPMLKSKSVVVIAAQGDHSMAIESRNNELRNDPTKRFTHRVFS
jgi:alpha-tubulin suppressor-like RCC1 family protein